MAGTGPRSLSRSNTPTLTSLWATATAATTNDSHDQSTPSTSNASWSESETALQGGSITTGVDTGASISGDLQSSSESDADQGSQQFSRQPEPPRKRRRKQKLHFKEEWKLRYLMLPATTTQTSDSSAKNCEEMICVQCQETMKAKSSTATRHVERKHPTMATFSLEKKKKLLRLFESRLRGQQSTMAIAMKPDEMVKLASYKLAFVISKHKMPFSSCEASMEFARSADPNSSVFSKMPCSRDTITKRTQEIHKKVLKPSLVQNVKDSPFWTLIADESTDTATQEQLGLYVRYVDLQKEKTVEEFLEMKRIIGHPTADNIFKAIMEVIDKEESEKLPIERLVGLTTDGAAVMISDRGGVYGKMKANVNSKLFSTHCPPHRLILASKAGQKELPTDIEKTVADTLFFFKDSSVRRDEFSSLKDLVEPDSPHVAIVQYHKIRWLSLADCVSRLVKLLPLLVRYFEEQSLDTSNRQAVRTKCADLNSRLSDPKFQLYLFFLHPQLEALAKINKWLQTPSLPLHTVYGKIKALLLTFTEPVALDNTKSVSDSCNLRPLNEAIPLFPGADFQKHYSDCHDHALLDSRELQDVCKSMYQYIVKVGESLERRFPEMEFMATNTAFPNPLMRGLQKPDIPALVNRFNQENGAVTLFVHSVKRQFPSYLNDSTIEMEMNHCGGDIVKFWCHLYKNEEDEYKELSSLALLLLSISPTSVLCERGFSIMNYVKNDYRLVMTQENLNACLAIGMSSHSMQSFPFHSFLK